MMRWQPRIGNICLSGYLNEGASQGVDLIIVDNYEALSRAGADWILTYAAREAAALLRRGWEE